MNRLRETLRQTEAANITLRSTVEVQIVCAALPTVSKILLNDFS